MKLMYRWTETSKPYGDDGETIKHQHEVIGNAIAISRIAVILGDKPHISGEVLDANGDTMSIERFHLEWGREVCALSGTNLPAFLANTVEMTPEQLTDAIMDGKIPGKPVVLTKGSPQ